jgi:ankyrin repeat protein
MRALIALLTVATAQAASPDAIRLAVTKAVALMQASQKEWDEGWACASCHHQYLTAIAYESARHYGIQVNEEIARADAEMGFRGLSNLSAAVEGSRAIEPSIGDAYRLWAAEASGYPVSLAMQADVRMMAGRQKPDGHWDTMDQRPPQSHSPFTATALAIRSLRNYSWPGAPSLAGEAKERILKARTWLTSHTPGDTEGHVFRLLGLRWTDAPQSVLQSVEGNLLRVQHSDGGWGMLPDLPSDAYSTGQVLFALSGNQPARERGIEFLLRTQQKDGSWHVRTRLHPPAPLSPDYFESGYPYEHDQYLSMMGAAWAVIALTGGEEPRRYYSYRRVDPSWEETVLFETADGLREMLNGTFGPGSLKGVIDPNSHTPEGTTALMMAVPDAAKTKLLLDRGADPNARSKSKFSALDIAAQYRDSEAAIRLLLEHGAKPNAGNSLQDPHPMVLAAFSGSIGALKPLKDAGAGIDDPAILGGVLYATPLIIASMTGEAATVKALLDLGADINQPDGEGLTALHWATLANRTDAVRMLLDRKADPNRVDRYGMTPLLYAASVDYGDTAVLDLLLAHGARKDARTKEGLTALERAQKFHHTRFLSHLQPTK